MWPANCVSSSRSKPEMNGEISKSSQSFMSSSNLSFNSSSFFFSSSFSMSRPSLVIALNSCRRTPSAAE
eukprot:4336459-Heterocapsa_arctica.AAC.1